MKKYNVLIAGATGLVGKTILKVLEERKFPVNKILLCASNRIDERYLRFKEENIQVQALDEIDFNEIDFSFFATEKEISLRYVPKALAAGNYVIDNSSAYRMDPAVPLVIPEANGDLIQKNNFIYANPNCSTAQLAAAVNPLHLKFGLERITVTTLQAVSGSGLRGLAQLKSEREFHQPVDPVYPHRIYNNCIPQIGVFDGNGNCEEELKIISEIKKILRLENLIVAVTTVRVPVENGHSESVLVEFKNPVDENSARQILAASDNIILQDFPNESIYPIALNSSGHDEVYVGRIRKVNGLPNALQFWVVADNLRKGAASNAIQIAEQIIKL